jgi:hypothetical protein
MLTKEELLKVEGVTLEENGDFFYRHVCYPYHMQINIPLGSEVEIEEKEVETEPFGSHSYLHPTGWYIWDWMIEGTLNGTKETESE